MKHATRSRPAKAKANANAKPTGSEAQARLRQGLPTYKPAILDSAQVAYLESLKLPAEIESFLRTSSPETPVGTTSQLLSVSAMRDEHTEMQPGITLRKAGASVLATANGNPYFVVRKGKAFEIRLLDGDVDDGANLKTLLSNSPEPVFTSLAEFVGALADQVLPSSQHASSEMRRFAAWRARGGRLVPPAKDAPFARGRNRTASPPVRTTGVVKAKIVFAPDQSLPGPDDLWIDDARIVGFAGDKGYTQLQETDDLIHRSVKTPSVSSWLQGVCLDGGLLLAGGERGKLYTSKDRGKTWRGMQTPTKQRLVSVARFDDTVWIAGDDGYVAHNTGKGWEQHHLGLQGMTRLKVIGEDLFVLNCGIWRFVGREAYEELRSAKRIRDLIQAATGTFIAVGDDAAVYRVRDGDEWTRNQVGIQDHAAVVEIAGGIVLVRVTSYDPSDLVLLSTDDGVSFAKVPLLDSKGAAYTGPQLGFTCAASDGRQGAVLGGYQGLLVRVAARD